MHVSMRQRGCTTTHHEFFGRCPRIVICGSVWMDRWWQRCRSMAARAMATPQTSLCLLRARGSPSRIALCMKVVAQKVVEGRLHVCAQVPQIRPLLLHNHRALILLLPLVPEDPRKLFERELARMILVIPIEELVRLVGRDHQPKHGECSFEFVLLQDTIAIDVVLVEQVDDARCVRLERLANLVAELLVRAAYDLLAAHQRRPARLYHPAQRAHELREADPALRHRVEHVEEGIDVLDLARDAQRASKPPEGHTADRLRVVAVLLLPLREELRRLLVLLRKLVQDLLLLHGGLIHLERHRVLHASLKLLLSPLLLMLLLQRELLHILLQRRDVTARASQDRVELLQAQLAFALHVPTVKDGVGSRVLDV
mmetsp:Transcript_35144/g.88381  ORF Transcript_35144/g.88381 Transcript_35144/m.88381 type:complete len:370 (+) Transcript_35144:3-1112(+)